MKLELLHCRPQSGTVPDHTPILFVHGSYCGAWVWSEFWMPYFADHGFPAYAVSLRGHGASEGDLADASLEDYMADVESALEKVGRPAVLVGHSMGGLVVQHLLCRNSGAIRAAVLLASVPPSGLTTSMAHLAAFSPDILWELGRLQTLGGRAVSAQVIRRAFFSEGGADAQPERMARLLPRLQRESKRIGIELMTPPWPMPQWGTTRVPALVLGGDADAFLPVSAYHETALAFGAELMILRDAPHGLMLDDNWWQPSADHVIDWLARAGF